MKLNGQWVLLHVLWITKNCKHVVEVIEFNDEYKAELAIFCKECKELGFKNNESLEAMNVADPNIMFWLVIINDEVACVSGVQRLLLSDADAVIRDGDYRIQYRTATLPKYQHYHKFNRYFGHVLWLRYLFLPMFKWSQTCGAKRIITTANVDSAYGPYMDRAARHGRSFGPNKKGRPVLFTEIGSCILFNVEQVIFDVNQDNVQWWYSQWKKVGNT